MKKLSWSFYAGPAIALGFLLLDLYFRSWGLAIIQGVLLVLLIAISIHEYFNR